MPKEIPQPAHGQPLPGAGFQPTELMVISTPEQLKAISDPLRLNILEVIAKEALTVKQIAARMNLPPTRLYYHIAELEAAGFVTLVDTRVKSGIIEKYYRTSAENFTIKRKLLNVSEANPLPDVVAMVFETTMQELSRSIAAGLVDPEGNASNENLLLNKTLVSLRREDVPRFMEKFNALLAELEVADAQADAQAGSDLVRYGCLVTFFPRPGDPGADLS